MMFFHLGASEKPEPVKRRRVILLLSVGWLPPSLRPSGACLCLGSRVLYTPLNAVEGDPTPGRRLCRCTLANLLSSSLNPRFKGVWYAAVNFAPLLPLDTRPDQCPRPHRRSDDGAGRHGPGGLSYDPRQTAPASPGQRGRRPRLL
jgi:hypothetical protein